jgi:hypothetical protein
LVTPSHTASTSRIETQASAFRDRANHSIMLPSKFMFIFANIFVLLPHMGYFVSSLLVSGFSDYKQDLICTPTNKRFGMSLIF